MTVTDYRKEAQQTLDTQGVEARVITAEVVVEEDEAVQYATKLLARTMSYLEVSREKTVHKLTRSHVNRIRRELRDLGLTQAQIGKALPRFETAATAMLTYAYDLAADDLRQRLQTDFAMHLIPRLHKEN